MRCPLWIGLPGPDPGELFWSGPGAAPPSGVVLFGRNLDPDPGAGPARCHALIQGLRSRWGEALLLSIDQEGGRVSRLLPWVGPTPSLRRTWLHGGAAECEAWGRRWGRGLRLLGFDADLAPVADLYDGNAETGQGERCASEDPGEAARAAGAFLHGLESEGLEGSLKHFPGLASTRVDSHKDLPEVMDEDQFRRNLEPFRMLAHPARFVMVAHLRTPWSEGRPASLHRGHVAGNPWGVSAKWITDDLEMGGCAAWPWPQRARMALEAGHEALLVCQSADGIRQATEAWRACGAPVARGRPARHGLGEAFDAAAWDRWRDELQGAARRVLG
ncbi:MAG: hypothetical protein HY823_00510 [Acidobacteria bacterium]|nr:hypothetical protein [Acidobacteriota bacterium]